jgi:hypothetical protein
LDNGSNTRIVGLYEEKLVASPRRGRLEIINYDSTAGKFQKKILLVVDVAAVIIIIILPAVDVDGYRVWWRGMENKRKPNRLPRSTAAALTHSQVE